MVVRIPVVLPMGELHLKVVPGSSRDAIAGWLGNRLKIKVRQPPEKGRANDAVTDLLAKALGISSNSLSLASGATSALKTFAIPSLDDEEIRRRHDGVDSPPKREN